MSITVADDLKGGWTSRSTTDYETKFKTQALLKRQLCTPVFWTSEFVTPDLIRLPTLQYEWRAVF